MTSRKERVAWTFGATEYSGSRAAGVYDLLTAVRGRLTEPAGDDGELDDWCLEVMNDLWGEMSRAERDERDEHPGMVER